MINIDLSSLAFVPSIENDVVQYVAKAMDLFSEIPSHRFIVKSYEKEQYVDNGDTYYVNHSAYADAKAVQVLPAANTNKFFYGNALVGFHLNAIAGAWTLRVTMRGPGIYPILYYTSNVVNPLLLFEVVNIKLPMMPIYDVSISVTTTGAGDVASIFSHSVWNGLYFAK